MALERILVGDDRIDFARENFPFIPNAEADFTESPQEVIRKGKTGEYTLIVTDLEYTREGREGFEVLEALKEIPARKILWTGRASEKEVQEKARELGAEVLDKDEIGTLVGQVVNKAPLKKDGKILIYTSNNKGSLYYSIEKVAGLIFDESEFTITSDLRAELQTGQYGLVIDTTPMLSNMKSSRKTNHGTVAHDMKYMKLAEVPRVACLTDIGTAPADLQRIGESYLASIGKNSRETQ